MAKKRKHATKTTRRRTHRRIGAAHGGGILGNAEEVLGMVIGAVITTSAQRVATQVNPKLIALAGIGLGLVAKNKSHNAFVQGAANGMITTSAVHLAHDVGMLRGVDEFVSGIMGGLNDGMSGRDEYMLPMNGLSNNMLVNGMPNGMLVGEASFDPARL